MPHSAPSPHGLSQPYRGLLLAGLRDSISCRDHPSGFHLQSFPHTDSRDHFWSDTLVTSQDDDKRDEGPPKRFHPAPRDAFELVAQRGKPCHTCSRAHLPPRRISPGSIVPVQPEVPAQPCASSSSFMASPNHLWERDGEPSSPEVSSGGAKTRPTGARLRGTLEYASESRVVKRRRDLAVFRVLLHQGVRSSPG